MSPDPTIHDLLLGWRDDALTPEQYEQLVALLQSPDARRALVEEFTFAAIARESAALAPHSAEESLVAVNPEELESLLASRAIRIEAKTDVSSTPAAVSPGILPPGKSIFDGEDRARLRSPATQQPAWGRPIYSFRRTLASVAAVAAIFIISAAAVWRFGFMPEEQPAVVVVPPQPAPVAHVVSIAGALEMLSPDGTIRSAIVGEQILPGQTLRTLGMDSYAAVEFDDRTRLELSVDTTVRFGKGDEIARGKRVYFTTGVLRADVSKQPADRPMIVSSPQAEIRVVGTRFSVSSAMSDATRIDMESGSVQLVRQSDGRTVDLSAGSYAVARADSDPVVVQQSPTYVGPPRRVFNNKWSTAVAAHDGRLYAGTSRGVQVWDGLARFDYQLAHENVGEIGPIAFADNGRFAALAASRGGKIHLWDLHARRARAIIDTHLQPSKVIAVAPDGAWVAAVDPRQANTFHIFDPVGGADGLERSALHIDELREIRALAASPNGGRIAVAGSGDKRIGIHRLYLYDPRTGESRGALAGHAKPVRSIAFSPDGRTLASAGDDGTLRLWDVATRSLLLHIDGHEQPLNCLAFSSDGTMIAGGGNDGRVWIWDTQTGNLGLIASAGFRAVRSIAFTPDNRRLITAGFDTPVMVFDLPVAERWKSEGR